MEAPFLWILQISSLSFNKYTISLEARDICWHQILSDLKYDSTRWVKFIFKLYYPLECRKEYFTLYPTLRAYKKIYIFSWRDISISSKILSIYKKTKQLKIVFLKACIAQSMYCPMFLEIKYITKRFISSYLLKIHY